MIATEFGRMRTCCNPNTGDVWFCLADVCKALDIKNPRDAKTTLTDRGLILLNVRELDNTLATTEGIPTEDLDIAVGSTDGTPTEDLDNTITQSDETPTKRFNFTRIPKH